MPGTLEVIVPAAKLPLYSVVHAALGIRAGPLYHVLVADSLHFMRTQDSADLSIALGLLAKTAVEALLQPTDGVEKVKLLSDALLSPSGCDDIWPVTFDIARLTNLQDSSAAIGKNVKNLLASETFIPCIIAASVKIHQPYPFRRCISELDDLDRFLRVRTRLPTDKGRYEASKRDELICLRQDPKNDVDREVGTIYITDTPADVARKINKGHCRPGDITYNPVLAYLEQVIIPFSRLIRYRKIIIGEKEYKDIASIREDFVQDILTPQALKAYVSTALGEVVAVIQESSGFQQAQASLNAIVEAEKKKKEKKKNPK
ncbi:putative Nucleotidyl transferase [Giardia muris]|uniref:tyrosine--tRNA ligase n=1 Tax=Giardia muris TaxID=5742 RepID=A0A4Z1T743_GIAMU|nr:putative Nucleotidyl transferase [Giardia muris]|eukprot:TNJ28947.1 putative Nucleotidyl transferase [Giardia muris]